MAAKSFPAILTRIAAMGCVITLVAGNAPTVADNTTPPVTQSASLTPDQLDNLVAPLALYPDPLLSQILVASTYPLEIVQANQWLQQHSDLKGQDLTTAAQQQNWDPSIQALVVFPDVLKRLSQDVTWTTNLGNAFLANQASVMDAIQRMRAKAEAAGKLTSTPQEKVVNTTDAGQPVVEIQPTNPQVIYVPEYDPVWIWGPPVYYPYPAWYYPPEPVGVWWVWGPPIWLSVGFVGCCGWGGWGWGPRWHEHTIIVNNYFIHRYNFNSAHVTTLRGENVWVHSPEHRMGVAYPNRALHERFRAPVRSPITVGAVQAQFRAAAVRVHSPGTVDRFGSRQIGPGVFNRNRSAFGGIENGTTARVHSDRGFSSLNRARIAPGSVRTGGVRSAGGHVGGGSIHNGQPGRSENYGTGGGWGGGHH